MYKDKDVRQLLTLLARLSEPDNIDIYFDGEDNGFNMRYTTYLKELSNLVIQSPISNKLGNVSQMKK